MAQRYGYNTEKGRELFRLCYEALEDWPEFETDDPINGADFVQWFADWRGLIKGVLEQPV